MKLKRPLILNIIIIVALIAFIVVYASKTEEDALLERRGNFVNTTASLAHMTNYYLEKEELHCQMWARHINSSSMDMEEAIEYLRDTLSSDIDMAHIVYFDGEGALTGMSTHEKNTVEGDYTVSYDLTGQKTYNEIISSDLFSGGTDVYMTRAYTNPTNGQQSVAFCHGVTLYEDGEMREAALLRIVPISYIEERWIYPIEDYADASISLVDASGDYIIRGGDFKNSNFLEFYKSYNVTNTDIQNEINQKITQGTGSLTMQNSRGETCILAYSPVGNASQWSILTMIPESALSMDNTNWGLIITVTLSLLILLAVDCLVMYRFNQRYKKMALEAEAASRAKTEFLSTMSHDIRTPMNAIIGLTSIAQQNLQDSDAVRECLRKINMSSNHLLTLINDMLDITKVESGRLTMNASTFSISEVTENLVNLVQPTVKEKNLNFNFRAWNIENELLFADQLRLNQVYINLISNAMKYTQPGGSVDVDIKEEKCEKPGYVRLILVVADTGIGMSKEFMEHMYEPFSRETNSRVNVIQGSGLGLAITKRIVDLMDGTIECESNQGVGTTFRVAMDLQISDKKEEDMVLPNMRVLLADDDPVVLKSGALTLQAMGTRPLPVANGKDAVRFALEAHEVDDPFELIILDWKMPGMEGLETVRTLREELGKDTPILIVSAYDWTEIEEEAKAAGVTGFIPKPLLRSSMYWNISKALGLGSGDMAQEKEEELEGINLLIAEDNELNWEVISTMLDMHGVTCERVENGQLAIERLERSYEGEFTLVFMDIQMPVMNGLDATRAIRQMGGWQSRIPIIAMTADAFSENVTECLDAGMNGHLAKPIDIKLVIKEIKKVKEQNR